MATFEEIELFILRNMTPTQKLHVAEGLWHTAWSLKTAGVRMAHPDWIEAQIEAEVRAIFGRADF